MRRLLLLGAVLAMLAAGSITTVAAQSTTSAAAGVSATCAMPRYDLASLLKRLSTTPAATQAAQAATKPTPPSLAGAKPADPATVMLVETLMRQFVACGNTGDTLREFSFFTDRYLVQAVTALFGGHITATTAEEFAKTIEQFVPTPVAAAQQTVLDHVAQVQVLPDGRITAEVYGRKASASGHGTPVLFVFVKVGAKLLIDGFYITQGTPTP